MTWFGLLSVILLTPVVICIGFWLVCAVIEIRGGHPTMARCSCGRRVVIPGRGLYEGGTQVIHAEALCQPYREWIA